MARAEPTPVIHRSSIKPSVAPSEQAPILVEVVLKETPPEEEINPFMPAKALARSPEQLVNTPARGAQENAPAPSTAVSISPETPAVLFVAPTVIPDPAITEVADSAENVVDTIGRNVIPSGRMLERTPPVPAIDCSSMVKEPVDPEPVLSVDSSMSTFKRLDLALPAPTVTELAIDVAEAVEDSVCLSAPSHAAAETTDFGCNTSIVVSVTPAKIEVESKELLAQYRALEEATTQLEQLLEARNQYCESLEMNYEEAQDRILDYESRIARDAMLLAALEADLREQKVLNQFERIKFLDAESNSEEAHRIIARLLTEREETKTLNASIEQLEEGPAVLSVVKPEQRMSLSSPIYPLSTQSLAVDTSIVIAGTPASVAVDFAFDDNMGSIAQEQEYQSPLASENVATGALFDCSPLPASSPVHQKKRSSASNVSQSSEASAASYQYDERCPVGYRMKGMRFIPLVAPKLHYIPIEVDTSYDRDDIKHTSAALKEDKKKSPRRSRPRKAVSVQAEQSPIPTVYPMQKERNSPKEEVHMKQGNDNMKSKMRLVPMASKKKRNRTKLEEPLITSPIKYHAIVDSPPLKTSDAEQYKQLFASDEGFVKFCAVTIPELKVLRPELSVKATEELAATMWGVCTMAEKREWQSYTIAEPESKKQKIGREDGPMRALQVSETVTEPVPPLPEPAVLATNKKGKKTKKGIAVKKAESKVEEETIVQSQPEPVINRKFQSVVTPAKRGRKRRAEAAVDPVVAVESVAAQPPGTTALPSVDILEPKRHRSTYKEETKQSGDNIVQVDPEVIPTMAVMATLSAENLLKANNKLAPAPFADMSPIAPNPSDAKENRWLRSGPKGQRLSMMSIASSVVTETFAHSRMMSNTSNTSSKAGRRLVIPKLKAKIR